ncbi:hypothetical protein PBRA_007547 [Plasmodiophora brassicae]|uniref:Protein ENHANCED DISEASE RESISTANCE 2 C-terminal domain-containing protein n=1 Tax=Plasmodiophora brassicae TaxID=37360 RepID=A0A0G4IWV3_PLABS|nr:hypothetical protein PBRA_007547 [Plasmodiophora brassicae]
MLAVILPAILLAIGRPQVILGCGMPPAPERLFVSGAGPHTWSAPSGDNFHIRSELYLENGAKEPSNPAHMVLLDADIVLHNDPKVKKFDQLSRKTDSYVHYLRNDRRRLLVIVFQMHPRYLVLTFAVDDGAAPSASGALLDSLFSSSAWGDDECAQRFKMLPRLANFSIPFYNVNQPVLIASRLSTTFYRTGDLVEIDIDVFSSRIARWIYRYVESAAASLEVDLGFVLQGNSRQELPERILGAVHLSRVNLAERVTRTSAWPVE